MRKTIILVDFSEYHAFFENNINISNDQITFSKQRHFLHRTTYALIVSVEWRGRLRTTTPSLSPLAWAELQCGPPKSFARDEWKICSIFHDF